MEVLRDRVTILTNDAAEASATDVTRAHKLLEHGLEYWKQVGASADKYEEAERVINEAESKLASAANR